MDIEHIVPKSEYSNYTFHAKNLALSCPGCNTKKGTKSVLKSAITVYPSNGSNITIVHPHFDNYSQHIKRYPEAIYEGLSDKGRRTIIYCELDRLKSVLKKMKEAKSRETRIGKLVEELRLSNDFDRTEEIKRELSELTAEFL